MRGANAEEHLEVELLNKHRLSRKRPFMDAEAVRQPHRMEPGGGQVPYLDARLSGGSPDAPEGDDSPRKSPRKERRPEASFEMEEEEPLTGGISPLSYSPPSPLPEEALSLPQQPDDPQSQQHEEPSLAPQRLRPEDVPVPAEEAEREEIPDSVIDAILDDGPHSAAANAENFRRSELGRALMNPDRLDTGLRKRGAAEDERDRSRSPVSRAYMVLAQEFVCFLAKRKGKADSHEINYSRSTEEMQRKLDESRAKEWGNWLKYKAIRFPTAVEVAEMIAGGCDIIPMRWVDIDKNEKLRIPGGPEVPEKLKSRLVIRGDLEKESFRTDCPTASNTAINILLSYAANKELELHSGDITAAFLQGAPIERTLLLSAPKDGIPVEGGDNIPPLSKLVALMSVYGSKDAPRGFWLELRGELLKQGLVEVDPAFYALVYEGQTQGLLCSHVDDLLWTGGELMDELMKKVQERFTFGSTEHGSFRFCGRKIEEKEDRYVVTCPESLGKVKPIHIDGGRQRDPNDAVSAEEQSQMRAVLGSLGWVARLCRPELCYMCSNLQGRQAKPIVDDLVRTNKLLASAQRTSTNGIVFMKKHFDFDGSVLISMTDASHAAELCVAENGQKQGHRSQGGRFLLLGDKVPDLGHEARCHIIEWQSLTLKRVCRSTLQAEVLSSMTGSEAGQQVRALLYSLVQPRGLEDRGFQWKIDAADSKLLAWMSDCRSYIEYMSSLAPSTVSDKRLAIDMTCLRQELWRRPKEEVGDPSTGQSMPIDAKDQLFWMSTADMTADQLTKAMKWDAVRGLCDTNLLKLTTRVVRAGLQSIKE